MATVPHGFHTVSVQGQARQQTLVDNGIER